MTTLRATNAAITLTANAKAVGQAAGVNLASLQTQLGEHLAEAAILLKQIIAIQNSARRRSSVSRNYGPMKSRLSWPKIR
jgi:hypothetical protein